MTFHSFQSPLRPGVAHVPFCCNVLGWPKTSNAMRLSVCFTFLATSSLCTALAIPAWSDLLHKLHNRQANSTTTAAGSTYTVAAGDTLNSIAAAAGVPEQSLEAANPGVVATDLQVGEILDLPSSSTNTTNSNSTDVLAAMESNIDDVSEDATPSAGSSTPQTHPANGTSGCGVHHHHNATSGARKGTGTAGAHAHNSTHHAHNGTAPYQNGTLLSGQAECNASSHHHHHNGTSATGTTATGNSTAAHHHGHNGTASAAPLGTGIAVPAPSGPGINGTAHTGNSTHSPHPPHSGQNGTTHAGNVTHHHHHHQNGTGEAGTPAAGTLSILSTAAATVLSAALMTTASV